MTETTSIDRMVLERRVYAPVIRQPGFATLVAQAVVGGFFGNVVVVIAKILLDDHPYNSFYIFSLPFLLAGGLATGVPAGLLIWAGSKLAHGSLLTINRSLIGIFVMSLAWFLFWSVLGQQEISRTELLWALPLILAPGVMIGLITGSRLRVGRELVRRGEADATALKIFAGLTGLVLRVVVVFLFLASLILEITTLQSYFLESAPSENLRRTLVGNSFLFGHAALGVVILFVRLKFSPLATLAAIAAAPLVAFLWAFPDMDDVTRIVLLGYVGVWGLFLLSRSRVIDVALSALNKELRYYLID
ncbi:MAG TPA: hypothetical protein VGD38_18065 [Pyrinomonadaceae bacterium]